MDDRLGTLLDRSPRPPVRSVAVRPGSTASNFTSETHLAYCTVIIATTALLEPYKRAARREAGVLGVMDCPERAESAADVHHNWVVGPAQQWECCVGHADDTDGGWFQPPVTRQPP